MMEVLRNLASFIAFALVAMFVENAVFTRGFGVSRLVKLVGDSAVDGGIFCALLCVIQVLDAPLAFFLNRELTKLALPYAGYIRPLLFVLCAVVSFSLTLAMVVVLRLPNRKELMAVLPMATFNAAVMGPMLITASQNHTFTQAMGFALGSGLGYYLAVLIMAEGQRKINEDKIPSTFKGLPINLLYIGIVALAIFGFTGHQLAS